MAKKSALQKIEDHEKLCRIMQKQRNQRTCNKDGENDHGWRRSYNTCLDHEHDTMNLSRNFTLSELIKSDTAIRRGINNNPNAEQIEKLKALCENILQPVRDHFGRVKVTSGFRSPELCTAIGSSVNSQHAKAEAADFEVIGTDNAELFDWIKNNLSPDQLILEFYTPGEPNSGWIHASWIDGTPRASYLHAYKSEGKTKYRPIIGSARDVV
jgi:uncharacterized protein YcbK (DUF882 family)